MPQSTAIIFMFISDDVVLLLCLHASPHAWFLCHLPSLMHMHSSQSSHLAPLLCYRLHVYWRSTACVAARHLLISAMLHKGAVHSPWLLSHPPGRACSRTNR
jgi:hypothetical protein